MNGTTHVGAICPLYHRAAELIGRRWTGAIVLALAGGAVRFGDLAAAVPGISDRMLSERLKELEAEGLVARTVLPEHPVRIEYRLTEKGRDLDAVMAAIGAWAVRWLAPAGPTAAPANDAIPA
ncbi:MAG: Transcriptional regulator, HxlR family [uncultured Thermomicrobiales bacterium]|jgi:DNA-binding HxlR family transcriptional regulator|uniref:Transcriptional regulator, HxlR family n=1 Tax=uncultured Thermomicrobiales bacterium TaxID=1645740 RepID=A0A6J4UPX8_9BACT|nr:MAG: Transcriptional regulator, HxlR family [uncultured Thermomicrobiales bacterium]